MPSPFLCTADRDSVCAGDDCESHERPFAIAPEATVAEVIDAALGACALASISGGNATWIVRAGGYDGTPIAVVAQQWSAPRLLVSGTQTAGQLFSAREKAIFFRYWCQADPEAVHEALANGNPLPARY